jgi:DNA-directed RNA polymerase subunit N (RpoN/RPB10)
MIGGKQLFDELQDRDLVQKFMEQLTIEKKDTKEIFSSLGLRGNYSSDKSKDVLDELGLTRYCCRRMLISQWKLGTKQL